LAAILYDGQGLTAIPNGGQLVHPIGKDSNDLSANNSNFWEMAASTDCHRGWWLVGPFLHYFFITYNNSKINVG
jgi:hypothetical protein